MKLLLVLLAVTLAVDAGYKRICYYTNWSQYRPAGQKFFPENIDPFLCTHLIYSFASMEGNNLKMYEWNDEAMYKRFQNLKNKNPNLKTLIAVGGWNFGTAKMTAMLKSRKNRKEFVSNSIIYLRRYGFDGLDLDFEYPALRESPAKDKKRFSILCKMLKKGFIKEAKRSGRSRLLLSAAVGAGKSTIDAAYDVAVISKYLDWIGLMAYDLHGGWEKFTGHHAGLYPRSDEPVAQRILNVEYAAKYWVSKGCPKNKLIIGMASYGRGFQLTSAQNTALGNSAKDYGKLGKYTATKGFLAYYEICKEFTGRDSKVVWSEEQQVPYAYKNDQWVGYDNIKSFEIKALWLKSQGYAGFMLWSLDFDDFNGNTCGEGRYPLLSKLTEVMEEGPRTTVEPVTDSDGNIVTTTTIATTTQPTTTTEPTIPTTTTPGYLDPSLNAYGGGGLDFSCASTPNGFYIYTPKCGAFWSCQGNNRYYYACAVGLWFNPKMNYCDWPRNCPTDMKCIKN